MYKRAPLALRLRKNNTVSVSPTPAVDNAQLSKLVNAAIAKFNFQAVVEDVVVRNIEDYIIANKDKLASLFAQSSSKNIPNNLAKQIVDDEVLNNIASKVVQQLDLKELSDHIEFDVAEVADALSDRQLNKISQNIDYDALTERFNMDQLAACLDTEDLASYISVDSADLDYEKLASEIDHDALSEVLETSDALVAKIVAKRSFVRTVVNDLSSEIEKAVKRVLKVEPEELNTNVFDSALNVAKDKFAKLTKLFS
jgi:hypothetical protein